jgi:peptide subunit release factor 1 (eRF1)
MIRQEDLQELLQFEAEEGDVVSLFLDADTSQQTSELVKKQAKALLKEAGDIDQDASDIEQYLDFSYDWNMPGLAIFSCSRQEFFRTYTSAVAFRNRVRVNNKPYLKPLSHLLDHYSHFGVIVVDRIGARFFEYHLGELQNSEGTMGEDVRKLKLGGGSARGAGTSSTTGQRGGQGGRHEEEVIQRNMREAAAVAQQFFAGKSIRRLFIGGTAENVAQLREYLSKQLQSRVSGTFAIDMTAGEHEVRERSLELLRQANIEREQELVENMITTAAKGGNAVVGLDATLASISEGRVQTLVISDGYSQPGYADIESNYLTAYEGKSSPSGGELVKVADVVEAAISSTMEFGGSVEIITDSPQLETAGRIGALLRY